MAINRSAWHPGEHEEYEVLLAEVVAVGKDTRKRLDLFEALLADAIQAHRPWAREVERACLRAGLAKEVKAYQDRQRVPVSHDGQVLSLPKVQGTVVRDEDGQAHHQRELIEMWTWEQIAEKRAEALRARRLYDAKVAHYDRLLALRELSPESATPVEAARQLGIDLDEFLGKEAA